MIYRHYHIHEIDDSIIECTIYFETFFQNLNDIAKTTRSKWQDETQVKDAQSPLVTDSSSAMKAMITNNVIHN